MKIKYKKDGVEEVVRHSYQLNIKLSSLKYLDIYCRLPLIKISKYPDFKNEFDL